MDLKLKDNALLSIDNIMNIDYILASGQCNTYLLTLAAGNNYYIIDLDIEVISNTTEGAYVFQATLNGGSAYNYLKCTSTNANTFNWAWATRNSAGNNISFTGRCKIRIKRSSVSNSSITINGTSTTSTFSYGGDNYTHPLYLLPSNGITMKIWSIQIYKVSSLSTTPSSSNIIANFLPRISYNSGHYGEAALYDTISNTFKYSSSTGSFTAPTNIYAKIITAYIKGCPNVSGIDLLRKAVNLQRIRCDAGNVSGSVAELLRYESLAGFTDDYQEQQIPRIIGTWTLNTWYTNEELENFQGAIDGLTVVGDNTHNVETALENNEFAVQTIDSTKPNYNPAAAIILYSNGFGNITTIPLTEGGGRYVLSKSEVAQISNILATVFSAKTTVTDTDKIVSNDATETYNFSNFNEFDYFINASGFSFASCTNLQELIIPKATSTSIISKAGNQQNRSTIRIKGNLTSDSRDNYMYFKKYIIDGDFVLNGNNTTFVRYGSPAVLRIGGNITHSNTPYSVLYGSATACAFMEVMGSISFTIANANTTAPVNLHLGYSNIAGTIAVCVASYTRLSKIYVGDGSSRAADAAVFALYNADTDWSTYCGNGVPGDGKVDLWWNYNGEYKWYYITDNLTNCTNTNPDEWPHITRGNAYETTIVPDEGMTIDSLTVEMLDTDTTSPTYDTYIPQPTSYDSATGIYTISIPSVTGNVVITASAS